jgi:hypothetical protein
MDQGTETKTISPTVGKVIDRDVGIRRALLLAPQQESFLSGQFYTSQHQPTNSTRATTTTTTTTTTTVVVVVAE